MNLAETNYNAARNSAPDAVRAELPAWEETNNVTRVGMSVGALAVARLVLNRLVATGARPADVLAKLDRGLLTEDAFR